MLLNYNYTYADNFFSLCIEDDEFQALTTILDIRRVAPATYALIIAGIINIYAGKNLRFAKNILYFMCHDHSKNYFIKDNMVKLSWLAEGINFAKNILKLPINDLQLFDQVYKNYITTLVFI